MCISLKCLILVSTLALTSAYSARPQYYNNMAAANNQQYGNYQQPQQQQQQQYQQPQQQYSNNNYHGSSGSDKDAQVIHNESDIHEDGSYRYAFETSNGIKQEEQGTPDGTKQGSSSYISPEGIEIKTTYVADETGYHPVGDHIPKIPDYILRSLEYIRTHPYIEKDYYTGEVKQATFNNVRKVASPHQQQKAQYNPFNF